MMYSNAVIFILLHWRAAAQKLYHFQKCSTEAWGPRDVLRPMWVCGPGQKAVINDAILNRDGFQQVQRNHAESNGIVDFCCTMQVYQPWPWNFQTYWLHHVMLAEAAFLRVGG